MTVFKNLSSGMNSTSTRPTMILYSSLNDAIPLGLTRSQCLQPGEYYLLVRCCPDGHKGLFQQLDVKQNNESLYFDDLCTFHEP